MQVRVSESAMPTLTQLFVYGTLKPGYAPYKHFCAATVMAVQAAIGQGQLYRLPLGYPALVIGGSQWVYGYRLTFNDAAVLPILDAYEQHDPAQLAQYLPILEIGTCNYVRQWVDLWDGSQNSLGPAWAYVMSIAQVDRLQGQLQPDGIWQPTL